MWNTRNGIAATGGLCAIAVLLLAGCSGSSSSAPSAAAPGAAHQGAGAAAGKQAAGAAAGQPGSGGTAQGGSGTTARLAPATAQLIYTADLTVRAHDLGSAISQASQIVAEAGGYTSDENTSANPAHPALSTASLQLKIPVTAYQATLAKLASQLGKQVSLQQQTQQVADTSSRVASDQAAITQLRALLARTGSVADLLSVQNQINSEESDLESMQSQQRALNAETSYATVSLSLLGPLARPVPHHPKPPPTLTAALTAGWHALSLTFSWLLAVLGAAAPITAALALLAYLGYRGRRWLLRRRAHPASAPASE
jgi:hypothetical protein